MSITAERFDFLLELAARRANLAPAGDPPSLLTAAEADDATYNAWAEEPRPELGGRTPRAFAAELELTALLSYLDKAVARRKGQPPRLWAEELIRRLRAGNQAALEALSARAMTEPEGEWDVDYPARAALRILGQWGDEEAVPVLIAALASESPALRLAAAEALGRVGLPALPALHHALETAQDTTLRQALIGALGRMPRSEQASAALRDVYGKAAGVERVALVHSLGKYGDPGLAPLVQGEMGQATDSRTHWAICRVALHRLGIDEGLPPAPEPQPGAEGEDLYTAAWQLFDGGLTDLAAIWVREALVRLADQVEESPGEVDWLLYERTQELADQILSRSPDLAVSRYLDLCAGALHYYGVMPLEHLIAAVTVAGSIRPPRADALWAAMKLDDRFALLTGRMVALPEVEDAGEVLNRRQAVGLGPALLPLSQMALAARGLAHLAWTSHEEEAAQALMALLPGELAQPARIAELQSAMRGGAAVDSFRHWAQAALEQGVEFSEPLRKALGQLWEHTARWELHGHTLWGARELLELEEARRQAPEQTKRLRRQRKRRG